MATETSAAPGTGGAAFVRKSSGLVKAGTPWRIFVMTVTIQGLGAFMATFYLFGVGAFPQSNMLLALALCALFLIPFNLAYGLLSAAYPRSGGEYVFISRILHPALGFIVNFGAYIAFCFFAATGGYLIFTLALAPALQALGVITSTPGLTDVGNWMGRNNSAWLLGSITILVFAAFVCFGTQAYYRLQKWIWIVGGVCFVLLLLVFGLSSQETFVRGLNDYVVATGGEPNAYQAIMQTAREAGMPTGYTLSDTLGMFAVATSVASAGAYLAGEVRTPLKTQIIGGGGGGLFFQLVILLVGLLIAKTVGLDFNRAATYLSVQQPDLFLADQSPVFTWYAYLCTSNPILLVLMCLGIVLFTMILVPQQIIIPTRMLFAWSFDRLVPKQVADVTPNSGVPIKATIIVTITLEVLLALFGSGIISFINPILIIGVVWFVISVAAVLFPFTPRSRDAFRASQIDQRLLGVPVISILGLFGVVFFAIALAVAVSSDTLGANQLSNVIVALVVFGIGILYYVGVRIVRRSQGVNLDATFAELPPD